MMYSFFGRVLLLLAVPLVLADADWWKPTTVTKTVTHTTTKTVDHTTTKTVDHTVSATCPKPTSYSTTATKTTMATSTTGNSTVSTTPTSSVTSTTTAANTNPTSTEIATATGTMGLNDYAKATGKVYFGTAADIPGTGELQDVGYMTVLNDTHEFGQRTPANVMKYVFTEPSRGVFNYSGGDEFISLAQDHNQLVRCHNLVWYNQLPNWLTSQTWDNATLISIMTNHITNLVQHFGTNCYAWDVVNEALNDNGTLRSDIWLDTIGPAYLPIAFAAADAAAPPGVKLYYNDYNVEYPGPKATAAQQLIASIQAQGIRIDGAGLQSHFIIGETPSQASQESNMAAFSALGIDVAITELDVRSPTLPPTVAQQEQQKLDYASSVAACVHTARCVGVTLWDFDDTYSWIPSTFPGQGYGDVWFQPSGSDVLVKKAAYDGIVDALTGVTPT